MDLSVQAKDNAIIKALLGADNDARKKAETQIEHERNANPSALLNLFIEGMKAETIEVASLSCILLKKYYLDDKRAEGLTNEDLEQIKCTVMGTLDFSQPLIILKRKGDIISKIYARQGKNQDLLNQLVDWAKSESSTGRQFAMYVFEVLSDCHLTPEQLSSYKDSFMSIFAKSLTDGEMQVRVAALKATTAFLTSIDDSDIVLSYHEVMPQLLNTVVEALQNNEEQGKLALESMVDLANVHPEIWKNTIGKLVNVISQVISQKTFEDSTRASATEIVLGLGQQMPAALIKIDETKSMFFPALVKMLTEVEEDMDTWAASTDDKEVGLNDPYNTAVNAINRLSVDLGDKTTIAICSHLIHDCIQQSEWQKRQAGYMLMGLIAESCKESMNKNIDGAMKTACSGIMDEHPRVRYAGLSCIALLLTELSPIAQKRYHSELMPVLLKAMNEESMIKLQCHAVSTVINFAKGLLEDEEEDETKKTTKIMEQYSKQLFTTLVTLLNKAMEQNYEPLQEEVMNLLSVVASLIEAEFAQYYNEFMPLMMRILNGVGMQTIQQKTLRARTIETIGFMVQAVSEEKAAFQSNVNEIANSLVTLLNSELSNDDPQQPAIKDTLIKVAYFLNEDFHQFMPKLMPTILNDTKLDIDIKMESAVMPNSAANATGFTFKMKGFEGDQRISMNTSALESKISAFKFINMISESMGKSFAPYCETILPIMVENMSYQYSKAVRKNAFKTIPHVLLAVGEPTNTTVFRNLFPMFVKLLEKNIESQDLKEIKLILKTLDSSLKTLNEDNTVHKNYMDTASFNVLGPVLRKVLELVKEAKAKTMQTLNSKKSGIELDEEDVEAIKEELAKVCNAATYVMEISGQLVLNFKEQAAAMVKENLLTFYALNLNKYKDISESELLDATCFFCDFIEYAYHSDIAMIAELNTKFLEIFSALDSIDVKQTLSYGMGVFATFIPTVNYTDCLPKVFKALTSMISAEDAFEEENVVATESALGALGKLVYFQKDNNLINDSVVQQFLSKLPLTNEEEEAQKSHLLLCQQVSSNNPAIMNEATKPAVMEALVRIEKAAKETKEMALLTDEGTSLLQKLLGH